MKKIRIRKMLLPLALLCTCSALGEYAPDGGAIVCVNGTNRFTRALYGTCDRSRIETSDFPEMSMYLDPKAAWTIEMPGLRGFARCEARFENGVRRYILSDDEKIGKGARIEATVAALADADGGIAKIEGFDLKEPYSFEYVTGKARREKFFRDGDYGRDPSDGFCVGKDAARAVATLENGKSLFLGIKSPEGRRDRPVEIGVVACGEDVFAAATAFAKRVANRITIKTPDSHINAIAQSLCLAENGAWDDKLGTYMHGAIGWRMPLNGWRGAYLADLLGDHTRARIHFDNYCASQVTNVACTLPHMQDAKRGNARALEKWGTPMYSNGYICRNPNNARQMHHYDMNLVFIDELFWHLRQTGDKEYAKKVWPVITRHLAWEKRVFDPNNDHLYDAYCCIWASDALEYNGGEVTHSSAYNAFHNRCAAEVAEWIGEDPAPYRAEAEAIEKALNERLWTGTHWAEFVDNMGRKQRHDAAAAWTEYTAIDCECGTPEQRYLAAKYMETQLPHKTSPEGYTVISTTSWQPYRWSINNVATAEMLHTALGHWLAGNDGEGYRIFMGAIMDSCYIACGPGNFEQLSKYDGRQGECYRDFTDTTACALRAVVRGLFGISPNLVKGEVEIAPHFPADWDFAELHTADIDFVMKKVNGKPVYDVKLHYPVAAKVVMNDSGSFAGNAGISGKTGISGISGCPEVPKFKSARSVDLSPYFNDAVANLYEEDKYLTPAWPYTTLKMPASLLGDWCVPNAVAHKNNHEGDMKRKKEQDSLEAGWRIEGTDAKAVFTSLYDNYPTRVEIPVSGRGKAMKLTLVAATNHMQYHVTNAVATVTYTDGTTSDLALILPETLAPANSKLVDTWQFPCATANRERPTLGNAWADVQYLALDPSKELKSLALETWSNETVVGLLAVELGE